MSLILSGTDGISDVDGSASTPALRGTDANTGIFFPAADTIAFSEGGAEAMRIDSAGNVGIGTASPVEKLTVAGSISTNIDLVLKQGTTDRGYIFGTSSGLFYRATSGLPHVFQNVGTELMRIDSSGNVSLGGAAATARLYLSTPSGDGTVNISGDGTNYAVFRSQGASFYQLGSLTSIPMTFITNSSERMRITSGGYVGIGVTPAAWDTFPATLQFGNSGCLASNNFGGANTQMFIANNMYYASGAYRYLASSTPVGRYAINSGEHYWSSAASGTAGNSISETVLMSVSLNNSVALQGATFKSGTGITFPATQSASSDANTLDDYEEGTWTPSLDFGGSTSGITYTVQGGSYTKIGRLVYCQGVIALSNNGSGTGQASIRGLPFTAGNILPNTGIEPGGMMVYFANSSINVAGYTIWADEGATTATIYVMPAGGAATVSATDSYIGNSFDCRFFLTYCTA